MPKRRYSSRVSDDPKRLIVVGDRVLITPAEGEERTNVGLYLPPSAIEGRQVQGGRIVARGPGTPMAEPASMDDEPWKTHAGGAEVKYLPMQAEVSDYALFFRKAAVEITFEGETDLVVPQAAILVLVREGVAASPEQTMAELGGARRRGGSAAQAGPRRGAGERVVEDAGQQWRVLAVHQ